MELRELRIFLELSHELHFGRTAERLGLSQARVSQAIRSLELRVGGQLFARSSRTVELTPLGRQMQERISPAYAQLREAFEAVQQHALTGITGTLRIGMYAPTSGGPHLLEIVSLFKSRNPGSEVVFVDTGLQENPLTWLRSGRVDVAAMRLPLDQPDVLIGPILSRETRVLLVSKEDSLATRDAIDYEDVGDRRVSKNPALPPETMEAFIPSVTSTGRRLNRIVNQSVEQVMLRVALGEQVHPTVASWLDHHTHPGIVAIPIRDLPPSETALISLKAVRSPRVDAFIDIVEEVLGKKR